MKNWIFISLICLLGMTVQVQAQGWDARSLHSINGWNMHGFSKGISNSAPYLVVGTPVAMGVYALAAKNDKLLKDAIYIGTSVIEATVLTYGLKYVVGRTRPYEAHPGYIIPHAIEDSPSFPSGHTAGAFSLATSLCIKYPKWYVIAPSAAWACTVGISRMNLGVHYPSDVISGAAIGIGCAFANVYINRWLNKVLFGE